MFVCFSALIMLSPLLIMFLFIPSESTEKCIQPLFCSPKKKNQKKKHVNSSRVKHIVFCIFMTWTFHFISHVIDHISHVKIYISSVFCKNWLVDMIFFTYFIDQTCKFLINS